MTARRREDFGAVKPDNVPRPSRRRDPDADTPPPAPPAMQPAQAPAPPVTAPAAQPPAAAVAVRATTPPPVGDPLASMFTTTQAPPPRADTGNQPHPEPTISLQALIQAQTRRRDPMRDFNGDGTRLNPAVQKAIKITAQLTGARQQEVVNEALLGIRPLSPELLDQCFQQEYGYPRPPECGGAPRGGAH